MKEAVRRGTFVGSTGIGPDIGPATYLQITCPFDDSRFGIDLAEYLQKVGSDEAVVIRGLGSLGSGVLYDPLAELMSRPLNVGTIRSLLERFREGHTGVVFDLPCSVTARTTSYDARAPFINLVQPGSLGSTDRVLGIPQLVESKFATAVTFAGGEWFEDGVESRFSRTLSMLAFAYGDAVVASVERFLASPDVNKEVAVEAAQWLGEVDHPASRAYRKNLLEKVLGTSSAVRIRHGAAAGLAAMDDPSSLPAVIEARDRETNRGLQNFLQLVVDQLERTRACLSS